MKCSIWKRVTAGLLAAGMILSFAACNGSKGNPADTGKKVSELNVVVSSAASWPYNEKWKMWEYFREGTGVNLKVHAIPDTDFDTKVSLMMSSKDTLPDMIYMWVKATEDSYAESGAFVSLSDNLDKMPNMSAFLNSLPEAERKDLVTQRTSADGKMYSAPIYGTQTINNLRSWLYRKDIFEKNNVAVPTTYDEMYEAAKKLKKAYPNSYPICLRDGLARIDTFASSWAPYMSLNSYYDFTDSTWKFGPIQPAMKDLVAYFSKLHAEGLVSPEYLTTNTKSWEELMCTDRGFITFEYIVRIDYFNKINRPTYPEYTWASMAPPVPNTPQGASKLTKTNVSFSGYLVCNTGKQDNINTALSVLDWMYSDEGKELLSWGKEGETYEVKDGKKQYILPKEDDTPQLLYGVGTHGILQFISIEANEAGYSAEQVEECHKAVNYTDDNVNPTLWLPLNKEEDNEATKLKQDIGTYVEENISKMLVGQLPMSYWDTYVKDIKNAGADRLVEIYSQAYDRVMGK